MRTACLAAAVIGMVAYLLVMSILVQTPMDDADRNVAMRESVPGMEDPPGDDKG